MEFFKRRHFDWVFIAGRIKRIWAITNKW